MRVLIVDDDASVRKLLSEIVEMAEHTPLQAENADEGIARLARADILFTDMNMPGRKGDAVIRKSPIPSYAFTGGVELDGRAYTAGERLDKYLTEINLAFRESIPKPFDVRAIHRILSEPLHPRVIIHEPDRAMRECYTDFLAFGAYTPRPAATGAEARAHAARGADLLITEGTIRGRPVGEQFFDLDVPTLFVTDNGIATYQQEFINTAEQHPNVLPCWRTVHDSGEELTTLYDKPHTGATLIGLVREGLRAARQRRLE